MNVTKSASLPNIPRSMYAESVIEKAIVAAEFSAWLAATNAIQAAALPGILQSA
jgi:hypothetical protein